MFKLLQEPIFFFYLFIFFIFPLYMWALNVIFPKLLQFLKVLVSGVMICSQIQ